MNKFRNLLDSKWLFFLIFILYIVFRLPLLGKDSFNTDVWKWKSRSYDFSTGVFTFSFEKTIQKYHPGVTLMWVGTAGIKIFNLLSDMGYYSGDTVTQVFGLHFFQKLILIFVQAILVILLLYPVSKIFDKKYVLITFLILSIEPYIYAVTREFHLEGLMSLFMLNSLIWLYYGLLQAKRGQILTVIFSGIFFGLAVLTKTSAALLGVFVFLYLIIDFLKLKRFHLKRYVMLFFVFCFSFVLSFTIVWPAMYTHPFAAIGSLYKGVFDVGVEGEHIQLFMGKWTDNPGILFYPIVFLARTSIYFIIGLVGYILINKKDISIEKINFLRLTIYFALFYVFVMMLPSKKLDRYIFPSFLFLSFIVSYFYYELSTKVKKIYAMLFFVPGIICMFIIHPDYFSYYSPLVGGLRNGMRLIEPKWMFGQQEIIEYFKANEEASKKIKFPADASFDEFITTNEINDMLSVGFQEKYYTQMWPFIQEIGGRAIITDITAQAKRSSFFVYPVWDDDSFKETRFKIEYIGTIKVRGVDVYNVYKRIKEL